MLKLFVIGTALAVSIAATAIDTQIRASFNSGTQSKFDKQLTLIYIPSLELRLTLPRLVNGIALYLAINLTCRELQQTKSKVKTNKNQKIKNTINIKANLLDHLDANIAKRMQNKLLCYQDRDLA